MAGVWIVGVLLYRNTKNKLFGIATVWLRQGWQKTLAYRMMAKLLRYLYNHNTFIVTTKTFPFSYKTIPLYLLSLQELVRYLKKWDYRLNCKMLYLHWTYDLLSHILWVFLNQKTAALDPSMMNVLQLLGSSAVLWGAYESIFHDL